MIDIFNRSWLPSRNSYVLLSLVDADGTRVQVSCTLTGEVSYSAYRVGGRKLFRRLYAGNDSSAAVAAAYKATKSDAFSAERLERALAELASASWNRR